MKPSSNRKRHSSVLPAMVVLLALTTVPRAALAVTNHFSMIVLASLGWQLVLAMVVFVPFWVWGVTVRWRSMDPRLRLGIGAGVAVVVVAAFQIGIPDAAVGRAPAGLDARHATSCPPLGEAAIPLGLAAEDRLIDPRPPAHFGAYHVRGACNLDPERLREDAALRRELEAAPGRLLLVAEWQVTVKALYDAILSTGASSGRWQVLEAGSLFFQLDPAVVMPQILVGEVSDLIWGTRNAINTERLRDLGPHLVVGPAYRLRTSNLLGQMLASRAGPVYAQGWPMSILGDHPAWREHRQVALWAPSLRNVVQIEIRDTSLRPILVPAPLVPGVPLIVAGRIDTTVEDLDGALGSRVTRALFLCDNAMTCLAAEAFAAAMLVRGDEVAGYATTEWLHGTSKWSMFGERVLIRGMPFLPWVAWVVAFLAAARVPVAVRRRLDRMELRPTDRPGGRIAGLLRALNAFVPVAVGGAAAWVASSVPEAASGWLGIMLHDTGRLGMPALGLLVPILFVLAAWHCATALPAARASGATIAFCGTATFLFAAFLLAWVAWGPSVGDALGMTLVLGAPVIARLVGACRVAWIRRSRSGSPAVLPLEMAASVQDAGRKAASLARAIACDLTVPPGFVFLTSARRFRALCGTQRGLRSLDRALRRVRLGLDETPRIVRSTAPGEDAPGAWTTGRYASRAGVAPGCEIAAIGHVLDAYTREGVPDDLRVGVIVQAQVSAALAGVAAREPAARGGGILVESAAGDTAAVTSGESSRVRWGRIGRYSGAWVDGALDARDLPARPFHDAFAVLERRFGGPVVIEWAWTGRGLLLLQVRPVAMDRATVGDRLPLSPELAAALARFRRRPDEIVLDATGLADLQFGAGPATRRFVEALYHDGARYLETGGIAYRWLAAVGPRPEVVVLDGGLFLGRVPRRPFASLMVLPLVGFQNRLLRWRWQSRCDALERRIASRRDLLAHEAAAGTENGDARRHHARAWDLVTGPVAGDFLDASILLEALDRCGDLRAGLPDPLLAAASRGEAGMRALAAGLPYRSLREWSLEHPRLGESEPGWHAMVGALTTRDRHFPEPPRGPDRAARVARVHRLVALARDNLSFGAAWLRRLAVDVGEDLAPVSPPLPGMPSVFTLAGLERWIAGNRSCRPVSDQGFWVSGSGPLNGVVVVSPDEVRPCLLAGDMPIRVVEHPEVQEAAGLPDGVALVAMSGNRLSHAAQVLADRGIPALFGAEAFRPLLQPGARIVLAADGSIAPRSHVASEGDSA